MRVSKILLIISFSLLSSCNDAEHDKKTIEMVSGSSKVISKDGAEIFSSDSEVVRVSGGVIASRNPGKSTITVKKEGKVVEKIDVSVRPFRLYSIGNSHTWDLKPDGDLISMASYNGIAIENDWHIYCGHNIDNIVHHPENTCVNPRDKKYKDAINSIAYDAITIEPFFGSTGKAEVDAIESLIDEIRTSKSKNARIYIYYTWPQNDNRPLDGFNYSLAWNMKYPESNLQRNNNKFFISYLQKRLISDKYNIYGYIPAGDYLNNFDITAKKGEIDGFNGAGNLYRDYLHMNNIGKLLIAKLYLKTIFTLEHVAYKDGTYLPGQMPDRDRDITGKVKSM